MGKTSLLKHLALHYASAKKQQAEIFPDGVFYLQCGSGEPYSKIKQFWLKLTDSLGSGSDAGWRVQTVGITEESRAETLTDVRNVRLKLAHQKVLIIVDDIWEREVLERILIPGEAVTYLVSSEFSDIWSDAEKICIKNPTREEARQILTMYTEGLAQKAERPDIIKGIADGFIDELQFHPLTLAHVGLAMSSANANDPHEWRTLRASWQDQLPDQTGVQPMFEKTYRIALSETMNRMVDSLSESERSLLFLICLFEEQRIPEAVVRRFRKQMEPQESTFDYEKCRKSLQDKSLIEILSYEGRRPFDQGSGAALGLVSKADLVIHGIRALCIRQRNAEQLRSMVIQLFTTLSIINSSNSHGDRQIMSRSQDDGEGHASDMAQQVLDNAITRAMYLSKSFWPRGVAATKVQTLLRSGNSFPPRIFANEDVIELPVIERESHRKGQMRYLTELLNRNQEAEWKEQAKFYARKILVKFICQQELDDGSTARLIQLSHTTSAMCDTLQSILNWGYWSSRFVDENKTFSSGHVETFKSLLTVLRDNKATMEIRIIVLRTLRGGWYGTEVGVLDYESCDTILNTNESMAHLGLRATRIDSTDCTHIADAIRTDRFSDRGVMASAAETNFLNYSDDRASREKPVTSVATSVGTGHIQVEDGNEKQGNDSESRASTSEALQFRVDIQCLGFTSWDHSFNPSRILVLGDVTSSEEQVYFVFFHVEAMTSLFGIGLPHPRVSISLKKQDVLIEEVTEELWKSFWMTSYTGTFKPFLFERTKNETQGDPEILGTDVRHLSKREALSNFGISIDGQQLQKFVKVSAITTTGTSGPIKWEPSWISWVKTVAVARGVQGTMQALSGKTHPRLENEADTGAVYEKARFVVIVTFLHPSCPFYEYNADRESSEKTTDDNTLSAGVSFIQPVLTVELFFDGIKEKLITTMLEVQYEMACPAGDWPTGWFQDDLRFSFRSKEDGPQYRKRSEILSDVEHKEAEYTTQNERLTSYEQGGSKEGGVQAGFPGLASATVKLSTRKGSTSQSSHTDQNVYKRLVCILKDRPSFGISDQSIGRKLEYRASFWLHDNPRKYYHTHPWMKAEQSGLQSNIGIKATAEWELLGNDTHQYVLEASKKLSKCTNNERRSYGTEPKSNGKLHSYINGIGKFVRGKSSPSTSNLSSENVADNVVENIALQIFRRKFLLNHDFSQFFKQYQQPGAHEWKLLDQASQSVEASPVPLAFSHCVEANPVSLASTSTA